MAGETTVGSIVGFLRLDADQFHREIERSITETDRLDGKNVDVKVKADTAKAQAEMRATAAEADKLDRSNTRVAQSGREAGRGMGALATTIVALGPAIVPLATATVGLAAGFGAMGSAGVLAIVGIRNEMQHGTATGQAFTSSLNSAKDSLNTLASTAARGVLRPFQDTVANLSRMLPDLTGTMGEFGAVTGRVAGNIVAGLLQSFVALEPLMRDVGVYTFNLTQRFSQLMTGSGVTAFGDYVRSVFPQVMQSVEGIVGAAIHLVQALAPLGGGILSALSAFSSVISALPVDVLSALATTASSVFLGFKSYGMMAGLIQGVSGALVKMGVSAGVAATGMAALNVAAAGIGAVVAVATFLYTRHAEAVRQDQAAVDSYTDALRQSNGVINENVRATAFKQLQDSGAYEAAKTLGIGLSLVTDAALGNTDAARSLGAAMQSAAQAQNEFEAGGKRTGKSSAQVNDALLKLNEAVGTNTGQFQRAQQAQQDWAAASKVSESATSAADVAAASLAGHLGTTTSALQAATTAQQQQAGSAAAALVQMQLENDAAGVLKDTLDKLNGKALSAADAQNAFDSSLANMGTHVNATGKKITFTTSSIHNMSAASVALRGQLNGQVANLQRVVEANGGLSDSTGKARSQMVKMRQQIIDNAVAHGVDRKAVTDYIDKLLKIPAKIPPTKLDVDNAAALTKIQALKSALAGIQNKTVVVTTLGRFVNTGPQSNGGHSTAGGSTFADGGPVSGPGTGTSDSIPAYLSNGEYVMPADKTAKHRSMLDAMRAGKFANGGVVGFASGGPVDVPLSSWFSSYVSSLGSNVSKTDLAADHNRVADAARRLNIAEMKLEQDRKSRHHTALQIARDEAAIAKARESLASATSRQASDKARYGAQQGSVLSKFQTAVGVGVRNAGAFINNLEKLSARGYGVLAQQLANMGDADAERIAAQAAGASAKTLNSISANIASGQKQQSILAHMDAITAIYGAIGKGPATVQSIAKSSGLSSTEILEALQLVSGQLAGNRNAQGLLHQMSLDDATIARLVAAMSRVQVNSTISTGSVNAAAGRP